MNEYEPPIFVDNFAGGGGASTGIEMAIGRSVDIAINHDPAAIAMHRANHPDTEHYTEDVWKVDPVKACRGREVALAWFSPDCKHHSKAKGGKPVDKHIRGLAWVAVKWAKAVHPNVIMLENVEEFMDWGRLDGDSRPDPRYKGETFRRFVKKLERQGYTVEWKILRACDYGAPTIRKRFFLVARCDGRPICWPEPTHADPESLEVYTKDKLPWVPVADVLDFSLPCPSIFETKEEIWEKYGIRAVRPLSEKTMKRIARGVAKFVIENPHPFIIQYKYDNEPQDTEKPLSTVTTVNAHYLVAPSMIQYHDEQGPETRGQNVDKPLMTVDASNRYALVSSFMAQFNHNSVGQDVGDPLNAITAQGGHFGEVRAFLIKYYGNGENVSDLKDPAPTITAKDRMGLVTISGQDYAIADIGLRMLTPRELFDAQGFPHDYIIDVDADGNEYPRAEQVVRCGNAVVPLVAAALVRANLPEYCKQDDT